MTRHILDDWDLDQMRRKRTTAGILRLQEKTLVAVLTVTLPFSV